MAREWGQVGYLFQQRSPQSLPAACPRGLAVTPESKAPRSYRCYPGDAVVRVVFGQAQRLLLASPFHYTANPQLVAAEPSVSFRG